jgi:hypothetical protein
MAYGDFDVIESIGFVDRMRRGGSLGTRGRPRSGALPGGAGAR